MYCLTWCDGQKRREIFGDYSTVLEIYVLLDNTPWASFFKIRIIHCSSGIEMDTNTGMQKVEEKI